ncbi:MAG: hypothetical protein WBM14_03590 [Terracidiphilus sp.]
MMKTLETGIMRDLRVPFEIETDVMPRAALLEDAWKRTAADRGFLEYLKQETLRERLERAGITIPAEYATPWDGHAVVLNEQGKKWARIELRKYREQRVDYWAKIVLPILSLIVSIIALVVSTHHK